MRRGFNDYRVVGDVAYLALTNRKGEAVAEALVDTADLPLLLAYGRRWSLGKAKRTQYVQHSKPAQYLHRLLLAGAEVIDHLNGNGLDNRRSNLRACTHAENMRNSQRSLSNTSGYKGVYWQRLAQKWHVQIRKDGTNHYLGLFTDLEEAARAYDRAARVMHGEFARLNFPDDAQPALLRRPA